MLVVVFEQGRERVDAAGQRAVLRLHLGAEPRHDGHGRVQRVLVDQVAVVAHEAQHAAQTAGLEHGARLPGTHQLQHLSSVT